MRLALSKAMAGCLAILSAAALGACGGDSTSSGGADATGPAGKIVDIYSSLPLQGPEAAEATSIANGIKLALAQSRGKAGRSRSSTPRSTTRRDRTAGTRA